MDETTKVRPAAVELDDLDTLEAESMFIIREVVAEFEHPVMLFSGGKDSVLMLQLARKAFAPAPVPFRVTSTLLFWSGMRVAIQYLSVMPTQPPVVSTFCCLLSLKSL